MKFSSLKYLSLSLPSWPESSRRWEKDESVLLCYYFTTFMKAESTRAPEHENKGYAGLNLAAAYVKYRSARRVNASSLISIDLVP